MATAPDLAELRRTRLTDWRPEAMLRVPETAIDRPAAPVIDVHNHLGRWLHPTHEWAIADPRDLVTLMDDVAVECIVNLDGRWGAELSENLDRYDRAYPGRFLTFCHIEWAKLADPDGESRLLRQLEESVRRGARGVKIWKDLGLQVRDESGLVLPDDDRVIRLLGRAGELGLPVLIHTADPVAFFEPLDARNERLEELIEEPDWWFGDHDRYPSFDRLLDALEALVLATPGTRYIGAHAGCLAEDLDRVERLLDSAPNWAIDIAGRLGELGRQPRRFRALVTAHPDRVLFGTDAYPPTISAYRNHYRFLETADEAFAYEPDQPVPPQGRWAISAARIPDALLPGIYADNARRWLGL